MIGFPTTCCPSRHPDYYAQLVLKEVASFRGQSTVPVDELGIADYLGLEVREFSLDGMPCEEGLRETLSNTSAWLKREPCGKCVIWTYQDIAIVRKRMSILHERGHFVLPWHKGLDYRCMEKDMSPPVRDKIEREAYRFAVEIMMPTEVFSDDVRNRETSIDTIDYLGGFYQASLEATSIRYAQVHPGYCAIMVVAPGEASKPTDMHMNQLFADAVKQTANIVNGDSQDNRRLMIKYFVRSTRFNRYFRPGTEIHDDNPVFQTWEAGERIQTELRASHFGSSSSQTYNAECMPLGRSGKLLVLLWHEDPEPRISFEC